MLKFFRRIRRKLLDERKLKNYLLYAIGEILLVMIGILLALQVNNWNEERKNRQLERELLSELKDGLTEDLNDINYLIGLHSEILESQNILVEWFDSNSNYQDSLARHFSIVTRTTVFVLREGPYETLKEIGIRIVKNDSLRVLIQELYDQRYEWYRKNNEMYLDRINHTTDNVNPKYFDRPETWNLDDHGLYGVMRPMSIEIIKSDNEYKYQLHSNRDLNKFMLEWNMKRVKDEIQFLIKMIEEELD